MAGGKKGQRITVSLQDADYASLSALAQRYDVSLSWVTRQAIAEFLERNKQKDLQLPLRLQSGRG